MKQKYIIDTNIIVRVLTGDPEQLFLQAKELLDEVERGEVVFFVPSMVVAETCWVLQSVYSFTKVEIGQALSDFLLAEGVEVEESFVIEVLEEFYVHNVDFIDAYLAKKSQIKGIPIITWNHKDFKRFSCEHFKPREVIGE